MNRKERLALIKLMVKSLELPEKVCEKNKYGEWEYYKNSISEEEFKRKLVQTRKEISHLIYRNKEL